MYKNKFVINQLLIVMYLITNHKREGGEGRKLIGKLKQRKESKGKNRRQNEK